FSGRERVRSLSPGRGHYREERFLASGSQQRPRDRPKRILPGQRRWCPIETRRSIQAGQPEDPRRVLDRELRVGLGPNARTPESNQRRGRIEPHAGRRGVPSLKASAWPDEGRARAEEGQRGI